MRLGLIFTAPTGQWERLNTERERQERERERKSDRGSEKKREVEYNRLKSNNKPSKTAIKIRVGS